MISIFRDNLFEGNVALVTGGGTGIGRGIAEALARHGRRRGDRRAARPRTSSPPAEQIAAATGRAACRWSPTSASPRPSRRPSAGLSRSSAGLDIVVNNAAGNFFCPSADLSAPTASAWCSTSMPRGRGTSRGPPIGARLQDHGGQILNISATLHYGGTPGQLHVAAAKAAVDALTRTLAVEWGPQGIRVNAIAPGPIGDTEGARRLFPGEARRGAPERHPHAPPRHDRRHRQPRPVPPQRRRRQYQRRDPRHRRRPLP